MELRYYGWQKFLSQLENKTIITQMSKKLDLTYSHTVEITRLLVINGLITIQKKGRTKQITMTKKGLQAQELILRLNQLT
jgi:predicted transcriptional regulator